MGTALPGVSSRSVATYFNSTRGRFIRRCSALSKWAGSPQSGACRKTTGAPSTTRSLEQAGSSLPPRKRTGGEHPKLWSGSRSVGGRRMTRLRIFFHRLLGLFLKRRLERELEEEIRSHLEMQIEDNLRQGMSPEDARRAARLRFGGVEQVKETYRDK